MPGFFKIRTQRPNRPGTNRGIFLYIFICLLNRINGWRVISIERKGSRAGYHASKITDFISLFLKYPSQQKKKSTNSKEKK